jgi:NAD kinase
MKQAASHEKARLMSRSAENANNNQDDLDLAVGALLDQDQIQEEDLNYQHCLQKLLTEVETDYPVKRIGRDLVANFDFQRCVAVVVFGPDGLVANVAKYVGDVPIIGVNPDPLTNDGILLPFNVDDVRSIVNQTIKRKSRTRPVTLAEVNTNDGQRMLAFNDFFVGCKTHTSARYTVELNLKTEAQSSSGLIISTGAGSTGWMSSVFNMADRIGTTFGNSKSVHRPEMKWEDSRLLWAVREPFVSRHSSAEMVGGAIEQRQELVVGSQMDGNGVIFSDGIERDFIEFNSGSIAAFKVSNQRAQLVV